MFYATRTLTKWGPAVEVEAVATRTPAKGATPATEMMKKAPAAAVEEVATSREQPDNKRV